MPIKAMQVTNTSTAAPWRTSRMAKKRVTIGRRRKHMTLKPCPLTLKLGGGKGRALLWQEDATL